MEFRVLGPVELWVSGHRIDLGPAKQRCVLAALLLTPGRVVPTEMVIDRVWGEEPPAGVRSVLYSYVTRLRRALQPAGVPLRRESGGYVLDLAPERVDVFRFQELVRRGRAADDDEHAAVLRDALELWRSTPLENIAGDWAGRIRDGLAEQRLSAVVALADLDLRLGRHTRVVEYLSALVPEYPLAEPLTGRLVLALHRAGRQAEALTCYADARARIVDELGVEPGPELRAAHLEILRSDAAPEVIPSSPRPAQLPAGVAAFTGRSAALALLDSLLCQDGTTVVISAIAGTAGVGKTALAVHWAHRVRDRFPDGQLYVNLQGHSASAPPLAPIDVLARFLRALGVSAAQVPVDIEEAAGLYRSLLAEKQLLIVLDNAASPEQVRPLVPGSPGCFLLVTSRTRLDGLLAKDGARRIALDVLTPQEALVLLRQVLDDERVAAEPEAVAELARLCAYLPLALRIAAASLSNDPSRVISDYVGELLAGNRLAALEIEGDEHAVRAAFDLSYSALKPESRQLFRRIGLIPGHDITAADAAMLAGTTPADAARMLGQLAAAHLVDSPVPGRYSCHDLLRLYANDRSHDEDSLRERESALERLFTRYLHIARAAVDLIYPEKLRLPLASGTPGFADHTAALAWLEAERANLVAAVVHTAAHGPHWIAWTLADTLRGYLEIRRYNVDGLAVAQAGFAAAATHGDFQAKAAVQLNLACVHYNTGAFDVAEQEYLTALDLSRLADWPEGQADALSRLAVVGSDPARSADRLHEALEINRVAGKVGGQAINLNNLAQLHWKIGALAKAADYAAQSRTLFRDMGSMLGEGVALVNLAAFHRDLGKVPEALEYATLALSLFGQVGERPAEAIAMEVLACAHLDAGREVEALEHATVAYAIAHEIGDHRLEADGLNVLGFVVHMMGRHEEAAVHHRNALPLAARTSHHRAVAEAHTGLAETLLALGRPDGALAEIEPALACARRFGFRAVEGKAMTTLAAVHLALGDPSRAEDIAREALAVHRETGYRLGETQATALLVSTTEYTRRHQRKRGRMPG
ncbi:BTAD domain-containing putative transcriptional regulator [Lentzea sp. NPDC006480]|uniref:AfsR/SARP family transcriptional regulator n=1 Tax=Lentzea sp. NPDC006480 TaxID=3157176 RepID=UPI0033AA93D5